jgi:hypothetical protein
MLPQPSAGFVQLSVEAKFESASPIRSSHPHLIHTSVFLWQNRATRDKSRRVIREASAKCRFFTFHGSTAERGETLQKPYLQVCLEGRAHLA